MLSVVFYSHLVNHSEQRCGICHRKCSFLDKNPSSKIHQDCSTKTCTFVQFCTILIKRVLGFLRLWSGKSSHSLIRTKLGEGKRWRENLVGGIQVREEKVLHSVFNASIHGPWLCRDPRTFLREVLSGVARLDGGAHLESMIGWNQDFIEGLSSTRVFRAKT